MPETTDYDTIAERYAADIDDRPWNALYERPATLALLPAVDGIDVLDAGCGHGWYADWLSRHGARVVAVDRSAAMVALAQSASKAAPASSRVTYAICEASSPIDRSTSCCLRSCCITRRT